VRSILEQVHRTIIVNVPFDPAHVAARLHHCGIGLRRDGAPD
jgi:hypothetical protein